MRRAKEGRGGGREPGKTAGSWPFCSDVGKKSRCDYSCGEGGRGGFELTHTHEGDTS